MFHYSTDEIRSIMTMRILDERYGIEQDPVLYEYILNHLTDNDITVMDLLAESNEMLDFAYEERYIPEGIVNDAICFNYFYVGAFHIPGLMPYIHHPLFEEFIDRVQIFKKYHISHTDGIELIYLPHSRFSESAEATDLIFAKQPATFLLGMQDNGALSFYEIVEFLLDFRESVKNIKKLIEG